VFEPLEAKAADLFRSDLADAHVERPELFGRSNTRRPIRVCHLRATFVTLSLANNRTEAWVADRTGHKSSATGPQAGTPSKPPPVAARGWPEGWPAPWSLPPEDLPEIENSAMILGSAEGGSRTHTPVKETDFESAASAGSATSAW
jgi:hypothetical protein